MSISPDPGGSLPREEQPRYEERPRYAAEYPPAQPGPAPSSSPLGGNWFPPTVIVVQLLMIGGLFLLYRDLSDTRQAMQLQIVELKGQLDAEKHRLEAADEKAAHLRDQLADTSKTAQTLGRRLGSTERDLSVAKK